MTIAFPGKKDNVNQCKYNNNFITPMLQGGDVEIQLKKSVEKIQELNAEVSAARQDNLQLKVRLISQLHRRLLPNKETPMSQTHKKISIS